ncbi:hypothetical protein L1049_018084 [Liquidambar formosana]|uniref:RRM domain-containing protein n=1 Tax=Liquidambar formosana TaxID=63359 RepID=A0AAP0NKL4_LIQFO
MADVISMEEIREIASRASIDPSPVDLDSIRLPPGKDFGIKSEDDDLHQEDSLEYDFRFANIIVVDNLPVVPWEKFEKLEGVVRKIYSQIGVIKEDGLWIPVDPETQKTLGYCFIEYNTPQEAELAREKTNGYKLDRAHIFAMNMFDDFDRFMKVPDEWAPPETKPYTPGENLQQWLTDEKARDQFVICAGSETEVLWNDARHLKCEPVYRRGFLWRPRPPSLLSPEKEEEIAKNLKKYSKKYEAEDQGVSMLLSEQDREKRKMLKDEWDNWVNEWKRLHEEEKLERERMRDGKASDEEEEYEAKEVEVLEELDVSEEVLSFGFGQE